MKISDTLTVQAFIVALTKIQSPLAPHIQDELNQVSSDWQDDEESIKEIRRIVHRYPTLQVSYDLELEELYEAVFEHRIPINLVEYDSHETTPIDWLKSIKYVLRAPESIGAAKKLKNTTEVYCEVA